MQSVALCAAGTEARIVSFLTVFTSVSTKSRVWNNIVSGKSTGGVKWLLSHVGVLFWFRRWSCLAFLPEWFPPSLPRRSLNFSRPWRSPPDKQCSAGRQNWGNTPSVMLPWMRQAQKPTYTAVERTSGKWACLRDRRSIFWTACLPKKVRIWSLPFPLGLALSLAAPYFRPLNRTSK